MMKHWMQGVSKKIKSSGHSGVFRAAAQRHGESTLEYAHEKAHAPGKTGKRARLALAFAAARHK
jgi:hypothetical protein